MSFNNKPAESTQAQQGGHLLDQYTAQPSGNGEQGDKSPYYHSAAPSVSMPKGGGALKGIDEKFSVNAVNGTAGLSVPLPLTPGRGGFTPALSLSYNSGSGNSEFGLGWGLSLPAIQRRTDKLLPRYNDADESDVFTLAGAEDLVPLLVKTEDEEWLPDERIESTMIYEQVTGEDGHIAFTSVIASCLIKRYRPRIEGLFARIEQVRRLNGASWWRVTTKENITTWYGLSAGAHIADPNDPRRIFKWMPELSADGKGNMQYYCYKEENLEAVPVSAHEHNRFNGHSLFTNLYLKRIYYCNAAAYYPSVDAPFAPEWPVDTEGFHMELVLDYGEHTSDTPDTPVSWTSRTDAFSGFHAGFEIRTYRRCHRALMFHRFSELNSGNATLVRSLELGWQNDATGQGSTLTEADYITGIRQTGYQWQADGSVLTKSLPAVTMEYQPLEWDHQLHNVSAADTVHAPQGLTGSYQWIDLWGEGLPGILTEQDNSWHYKSNMGNGHFSQAATIPVKPSFSGLSSGALQWQDLDADGSRQLVARTPGTEGYFELTDDQQWEGFRPFEGRASVDWNSPYTKMLDLNGDGRPDLLLAHDHVWTWYENKGRKGFAEGGRLSPFVGSERSEQDNRPQLVLNDAVQSIFLADMNGDGLTDLVRIKNGEVCYWPNMGYGKFGAKVTMSNAPVFDHPDLYNPLYLQLTDVSGTGAPDLVYLGGNTFKVWINLAGNGFSESHEIATLPGMDAYSKVALLDFLGNGTGCIVWSSPLPQNSYAPMRYIDLMGGKKPYLMRSYSNGMGKTVDVTYKSSTQYYLADKKANKPWATRLPFPVQCIDQISTTDAVSETTFTQTYSYHHGYYDHEEREFRGFGRVEVIDTDAAQLNTQYPTLNTLDQPHVLTKTWYHTGAWMREHTLLDAFAEEYYHFSDWGVLPAQAAFSEKLSPQELREAHRALKGSALRQEIYSPDGAAQANVPYAITANAYQVRQVQPAIKLWGGSGNAAFFTWTSETLSYTCERSDLSTVDKPADLRLTHSLTLEVDDYGNVLKSAQVAYPRWSGYLPEYPEPGQPDYLKPVRDAQQQMHITISTADYTNDVGAETLVALPRIDYNPDYRLRLSYRQRAYELYLPSQSYPEEGVLWTITSLGNLIPAQDQGVDFSTAMSGDTLLLRLVSHSYTLFAKDTALNTPLDTNPAHRLEALAIPYEQYTLAFTTNTLTYCYGSGDVTPSMLAGTGNDGGGYVQLSGNADQWWVPSGRAAYSGSPAAAFYQPTGYTDPWGNETSVIYWSAYHLLPQSVTDALGNVTQVSAYDWHTLQPVELMDTNENISQMAYDALGMPSATAISGKGTEADYLEYNSSNPLIPGCAEDDLYVDELYDILDGIQSGSIEATAAKVLGKATWRCIYNLDTQPASVVMIARQQHYQQLADEGALSDPDFITPTMLRITYTDGFGRVAMQKAMYREDGGDSAGDATINADPTSSRAWLGSGKTVYNNKGKAVLQYEPYFSNTPAFDPATQAAAATVSPRLFYDALGRLYRTEMPDGTYSKTTWDSWSQTVYDANDTVGDSAWRDTINAIPATGSTAVETSRNTAIKETLNRAMLHDHTPAVMHLDTLGRPFFTQQQHRQFDTGVLHDDPFYYSFEELDITGNRLKVTDANGRAQLTYRYNLLKAPCYQYSIDGGEGKMLTDAAGQPLYHWDADSRIFLTRYDALRRPVAGMVIESNVTKMLEKTVYADGPLVSSALNTRGRMLEHYDGAGKQYVTAYDFKGMPVATHLQLVSDYQLAETDWTAGSEPALDSHVFESSAVTDALGRMITATDAGGYITRHAYDRGGMLQAVYLTSPNNTEETYVQDIHYNARGQRKAIWYGNNTKIVYTYDALSQRLSRQATRKKSGLSSWDDLADLYYYYDPVGNITFIRDEAADTVFSGNTIVEPTKDYTYDALYRLIQAKGREQIGNATFGNEDNYSDGMTPGTPNTNALQNYTQQYSYDGAGNMLLLRHRAGVQGDYSRYFEYYSGSNRLRRTIVGGPPPDYLYTYDARGNMTSMPHLQAMSWNSVSGLSMVVAGVVNGFYQYTGGQRIRKVVEKAGFTEERIYLGSYERYRKLVSGSTEVERDTVHVSDDTGRIAMLEVRNTSYQSDGNEQLLKRYIYSSHLQSSNLELNEQGEIISYEEYHPYGTTAYQAMSSTISATAKRYRFTGKERDEETGLNYHGARYYAPWLCRWTAVDPLENEYAPQSSYIYCSCNPLNSIDPSGMGEEDNPKGGWYENKTGLHYAPGITSAEEFANSKYKNDGKFWATMGGYSGGDSYSKDPYVSNYRSDGSIAHDYASGKQVVIPYKGDGAITKEGKKGFSIYDVPPIANNVSKSIHLKASITGSSLFLQLKIPILKSFPRGGSNPGFARFNLSFKEMSGYKGSTSQIFLNRTIPEAASLKWKGLRLDHGPNVVSGKTDWHWNNEAAREINFGKGLVADHAVVGKLGRTIGLISKYAKPVGTGMLILGATMDAYSLGNEAYKSYHTGDWSNTGHEAAKIAGGWTGAWAGAETFGAIGATWGALGGPIGIAAGGFLGGLIGGIGGYLGGSWLGGKSFDYFSK